MMSVDESVAKVMELVDALQRGLIQLPEFKRALRDEIHQVYNAPEDQ